ncbi:MAG: hydroxyacylglutathione hydrolase [Rhodomicrobium sp.]|nr:hydroxyacylglutathione hydrolase [Rhodomicrobium sp.]
MATLEIFQFPCWEDNYGVLIHDKDAGVTAAIDAPEENAVREALKRTGLKLTHIFTTHHHRDHVEGHLGLKRETGCTIYGPAQEAADIPAIDVSVKEGDRLPFGSFEVRVLETPGHTRGHVTYFIPDAVPDPAGCGKAGVAFAGDTLFSVGCGRVIEGRHAQMWHSLEKIIALPADTLIYCGHEYTQSNIRFALTVDGENEALLKRKREVDELRSQGRPSLPVSLALELETNPFLRVNNPAIRQSLGFGPEVPEAKVFEELRRRKDRF